MTLEEQDTPDRTSNLLRRLCDSQIVGEELTVAEAVDLFGQNGLVLLMLVLAIINIVLVPLPGISTIFGFPLLVAAIAYARGVKEIWIPKMFRDKSLKTEDVARSLKSSILWIEKIESYIHPRGNFWKKKTGHLIASAALILAALTLFLPIPLGNIPPAAALVVLCLGLMERDGLLIAAGAFLCVAQLALIGLFYFIVEQGFFFVVNGEL